jgi:hypothetical protein
VISNSNDGTFAPGTNEYTADIQSWVGLANAYIDLPMFGASRLLSAAVSVSPRFR